MYYTNWLICYLYLQLYLLEEMYTSSHLLINQVDLFYASPELLCSMLCGCYALCGMVLLHKYYFKFLL